MRMDYGRGTQNHLEKMVILEKWYSALKAYLPELYFQKKKVEEYNATFNPLIVDVAEQIEAMNDMYDPEFEFLQTCNPKEKQFTKVMRGICERLDVITAKSHIIDSIKQDDEQELFG
jgi:hypothetical protein